MIKIGERITIEQMQPEDLTHGTIITMDGKQVGYIQELIMSWNIERIKNSKILKIISVDKELVQSNISSFAQEMLKNGFDVYIEYVYLNKEINLISPEEYIDIPMEPRAYEE